jgi:hypothetical protein
MRGMAWLLFAAASKAAPDAHTVVFVVPSVLPKRAPSSIYP